MAQAGVSGLTRGWHGAGQLPGVCETDGQVSLRAVADTLYQQKNAKQNKRFLENIKIGFCEQRPPGTILVFDLFCCGRHAKSNANHNQNKFHIEF